MNPDNLKTPIALHGMRLPQDEKRYYTRVLQVYAQHQANERADVRGVTFGRHDPRGGVEICLEHNGGTVTRVRGFFNRDELLGYVQGYNDAKL